MSTAEEYPSLAALAALLPERAVAHETVATPPTMAELRRRRDEILRAARASGAINVRVFGSVARGDAGPGSDVDLLIDLAEGRSLLDIAGLVVALEDLLGCTVNVVREGGLRRPALRERIRGGAIPL